MNYTWEKLTPSEFELIACNYAKYLFPEYQWQLTKQSRDDNHDFYAQLENNDDWGEAKHSTKENTSMSKQKWDPTIVSARLSNSVKRVILVTCARIPLTYIVRSQHMLHPPMNEILYINRHLLNKWYDNAVKLQQFNSNLLTSEIKSKIKHSKPNLYFNTEIDIFIFDLLGKNFLVPLDAIQAKTQYEMNVVVFSNSENEVLNCTFSQEINFDGNILVQNLSVDTHVTTINLENKQSFSCRISEGYTIIKGYFIVDSNKSNCSKVNFKCTSGKEKKTRVLRMSPLISSPDTKILSLEKKINEIINCKTTDRFIETDFLELNSYKRSNYNYLYVQFDERNFYNLSKLCRLLVHMLTGIDFQNLEDVSIRKILFSSQFPEYIENLILSIHSELMAEKSLQKYFDYSNNSLAYVPTKEDSPFFYLVQDVFNLSAEAKWYFEQLKEFMNNKTENRIMIASISKCETVQVPFDDNLALVTLFDKGIDKTLLNTANCKYESDVIETNLENSEYFPGLTLQYKNAIDYIKQKENNSLELFLNKICKIAESQPFSSSLLDTMVLLGNRIPHKLYIDTLRNLRDIYYSCTDFFTSYGYSKIIGKNIDYTHVTTENQDDKYKEADALNHCGSIIESRELFTEIANSVLDNKNIKDKSQGLEALTEVYNIDFWLLNVSDLVERIDNTITTYFPSLIIKGKEKREMYPYYNCLNRKMVTQYLLELYSEAEKSFNLCLKNNELKNYTAFAYMDSARGLYCYDIHCAYQRMLEAHKLLQELKHEEKRRYLDCCIEKAYLEFVLATNEDRTRNIKYLLDAIYNVKKEGYKNILKKSHFKLAACFLVLGDTDSAYEYLELIKNDDSFSESPRNQMMYKNLIKGYYHLIGEHYSYDSYTSFYSIDQNKHTIQIEFNCFKQNGNFYYIETRLW